MHKYDPMYRKFQKIYKKAIQGNNFSKVAGYKIRKPKAGAYSWPSSANNEQSERETKKEFHLQ